jgi:hypothetical protein
MHPEIRVASAHWLQPSKVGVGVLEHSSFSQGFMDEPSSLTDIDGNVEYLLDLGIAEAWVG